MKTIAINGVIVEFTNFNGTPKEAANYVNYVQERIKAPLTRLKIELCNDGKVDVHFEGEGAPFERIRRITGYLTGDLKSWNNAKKTEERDRVKHIGGRLNDD